MDWVNRSIEKFLRLKIVANEINQEVPQPKDEDAVHCPNCNSKLINEALH